MLCPYALGWCGDELRVLCIQCGGESSGGLSDNAEDNWRCLRVSGLSDLALVEGEWVDANNHSVSNNCFDADRIEIEIAF